MIMITNYEKMGIALKILSMALVFALALSLFPAYPLTASAADAVSYTPIAGGITSPLYGAGLLNIRSMNSPEFNAEHVRTNAATNTFNMINMFAKVDNTMGRLSWLQPAKMSGTDPTVLWNSFGKTSNEGNLYWQALYSTRYSSFPAAIWELAQSRQLQFNFSAELKLDSHSHLDISPGNIGKTHLTLKDTAEVILADNYGYADKRQHLRYVNKSTDPDGIFVPYGDETAKNWFDFYDRNPGRAGGTSLDIKFGSTGECGCGSSGVRKMSFALADIQAPRITSISVTNESGVAKTYFMLGDTGRITLKFDEKVRFASDAAPAFGDYKLDFTAASLKNNKEVKDLKFSADLIELGADTMTFSFTVEETLTDGAVTYTTDFLITGIAGSQGWVKQKDDRSFPLKMIGANSQYVTLGAMSLKQEDLTHTSSLVTDLSGNPINWEASVKTLPKFIIDSVNPEIAAVELAGAMMSTDSYNTPENGQWPADIDRGAVFAGANDTFYVVVSLTEEISPLSPSQLAGTVATFNLDNNTVTAKAVWTFIESNGTRNVTKIVFESIGADVSPPTSPSQIRVVSVTVPAGLTDLAGNVLASSLSLPAPKQQLWIDSVPPVIELAAALNISGPALEPIRYSPDDTTSFYVPIKIYDKGNYDNSAYTSGVDNLTAWYSLGTSGQPYRCAASYLPQKPVNFVEGISDSFTIVNNQTVYLHFELIEGIPYDFETVKLYVSCKDYARNNATVNWTLAQKADLVAPGIGLTYLDKDFDAVTREGSIGLGVFVKDNTSTLGSVEYQWGDGNPSEPPEDGWIFAPGFVSSTVKEFGFETSFDELEENELHTKHIWVRTSDTEGNENIWSYTTSFDLTKTPYSYRLNFNPDELLGSYPAQAGGPTKNFGVYIDPVPAYSGDDDTIDTNGVTTIFLLEDMISEEPGDYFAYWVYTDDMSRPFGKRGMTIQDRVTYDGNAIGNPLYFSRWQHLSFNQYYDTYNFENHDDVLSTELEDRLYDLWYRYYGEQNAIILSVYGDNRGMATVDEGFRAGLERLSWRNTSTPYSEFTSNVYSAAAAHSVTFGAPIGVDGTVENLAAGVVVAGVGDAGYHPGTTGSRPRYASSLNGVIFPFTITNNFMPGWGVDDVDFVSPHTNVSVYYTGLSKYDNMTNPTYELIGEFPLNPENGAQQFFGFTDEIAEKTGYYRIEISVDVLGAGYNNHQNYNLGSTPMRAHVIYDDIFLYKNEPDYFGISDYNVSTKYDGLDVHTFTRSTVSEASEGYYFTDVKLGTYEEESFTKSQTLTFDFDGKPDYNTFPYVSKPDYWDEMTTVYWQFWNAADPDWESNAVWLPLNEVMPVFVDTVSSSDYGQVTDEITFRDYSKVPIMNDQETNIVCFRFALQNGYISPTRLINVYARGGQPELTAVFSPEKPSDGYVNKVDAGFASAYSPNGAIATYSVFREQMIGGVIKHVSELWKASEPFTQEITENGKYILLICDEFGNATAAEMEIDYVDGVSPIINAPTNLSADPSEFHYELQITDNMPITAGRLNIAHGVNSGETVVGGEVPILYDGSEWSTLGEKTPQSSGVYYTKIISPSTYTPDCGGIYEMTLEIRGVYPYIESGALNRVLTFTFADDMGNAENPTNDTLTGTGNIKPAFINDAYDDTDGLTLTFNAYVRAAGGASGYSQKQAMPFILEDGEYEIFFLDLFGAEYTETVTINAFGGGGLTAAFEPDTLTNQDVTVTLTATGATIVSVEADDPEAIEPPVINGATAEVVVKQNDNLTVTLSDGTFRIVSVINIDKEPPLAQASLTEDESGDIIITLLCDKKIFDIDDAVMEDTGEPLVYVIPATEAGMEHTFTYKDAAGNTNTYTYTPGAPTLYTLTVNNGTGGGTYLERAEVPITADAPASGKIFDKWTGNTAYVGDINFASTVVTMPAANVTVTALYKDIPENPLEYTASLVRVIGGLPGAAIGVTDNLDSELAVSAQEYRLTFSPNKPNVKLFITGTGAASAPDYTTGQSEVITGVTISGMTVTVRANGDFKIWLVDSSDASCMINIAVASIDRTAPTATITYVKLPDETGFTSVKAYLVPNKEVTVTNISGVETETEEGTYKDLYYHEFTANGSFIFNFADAAGNTGSVTARVTDFDLTPPTVLSVTWSGERVKPTNRVITAQFTLAANVRDVIAEWITPDASPVEEHITIQITGNRVILTYLKNTAPLKLTFIAPNNMTYVYDTLPGIENIDMTPPALIGAVSIVTDAGKRFAEISFKTDKPVICAQILTLDNQNNPVPGTEFTATVRENGVYEFQLTDAAGNKSVITAAVTNIDKINLELMWSSSATGENAKKYAYLLGVLEDGDDVYVKAYKDIASISLYYNTSDEAVAAQNYAGVANDDWKPFSIEEGHGTYMITAVDKRGEEVSEFLSVTPPDTLPPVITLKRTLIPLELGVSTAELESAVKDNLIITDNRSAVENISVSVITIGVNTGVKGLYIASVTATDEAGNVSAAVQVPIRIYGPDDLYAVIGKQIVFPGGTLIVSETDIAVEVKNLMDGEPYTVKCKMGMKTSGQMKIGAMDAEIRNGEYRLSLENKKYYTVYVRSQSRKELLFYVYVEQ